MIVLIVPRFQTLFTLQLLGIHLSTPAMCLPTRWSNTCGICNKSVPWLDENMDPPWIAALKYKFLSYTLTSNGFPSSELILELLDLSFCFTLYSYKMELFKVIFSMQNIGFVLYVFQSSINIKICSPFFKQYSDYTGLIAFKNLIQGIAWWCRG